MLGGGRFAQWLAGLCFLIAGYFLGDGVYVSTDMLQPLTWLGVSWCLVRLDSKRQRTLVDRHRADCRHQPCGAKYQIAFYVVALAVGMVATPLRESLARPWIYAGAALALVLVLPNILWQWTHGWPFLELGAAGVAGKNIALSPLDFFHQQVLLIGPLAAPVWLIGTMGRGDPPASCRLPDISHRLVSALPCVHRRRTARPLYLAFDLPGIVGLRRGGD